jgi:hypothetical protein
VGRTEPPPDSAARAVDVGGQAPQGLRPRGAPVPSPASTAPAPRRRGRALALNKRLQPAARVGCSDRRAGRCSPRPAAVDLAGAPDPPRRRSVRHRRSRRLPSPRRCCCCQRHGRHQQVSSEPSQTVVVSHTIALAIEVGSQREPATQSALCRPSRKDSHRAPSTLRMLGPLEPLVVPLSRWLTRVRETKAPLTGEIRLASRARWRH